MTLYKIFPATKMHYIVYSVILQNIILRQTKLSSSLAWLLSVSLPGLVLYALAWAKKSLTESQGRGRDRAWRFCRMNYVRAKCRFVNTVRSWPHPGPVMIVINNIDLYFATTLEILRCTKCKLPHAYKRRGSLAVNFASLESWMSPKLFEQQKRVVPKMFIQWIGV